MLVTDCWLTNAGDAAIALATQRLIERHAPTAAVLHAAYGADLVGDRYPELRLLPPLEALVGTRWAGAGTDPALVEDADLVVSQGGGFLREEYAPFSRLDALARVGAAGVPLVLLGQTIGRFDLAFARRTFGELLRSAAAVVVRDRASLRHALDLGADPGAVVQGTDVALALALDGPAPARDAAGPVAVVLSDYAVEHGRPRRGELAAALLAAVATGVPDRTIEVWSSAQGAGDDRDERVAADAVARLPARDRTRVEATAGHIDAHQLLDRTARAAAVVSMRLHPALLAAARGTPALLVLDDQKTATFDGTPLAAIVTRGDDPAALGAGIAGLLDRPPPPLGELRPRLDRTVTALARALAGTARPA